MSTHDPSSNYDDAWIANAVSRNPFWEAPADAANAGNIRSCPVRLSFCHLFKPQAAMEQGRPDKFVTTLLIPHGADLTIPRGAASRVAFEKWPNLGQPGGVQVAGLHSPFKDQGEKAQFEGYNPGAFCITAASERRAPVVDMRGAPIVEPEKVYPGVWAFVTIRPFAFETRHPTSQAVLKRGVSFGLQSVMILVDDKELGGGGGDPATDFAGINVEGLSPEFSAGAAFNQGAGVDPLAAAAQAAGAGPRSAF